MFGESKCAYVYNTKCMHKSDVSREELAKQQARANYQKMHMAGKTEEARADLARLAIIRKEREEAAKKRDAEKQSKTFAFDVRNK